MKSFGEFKQIAYKNAIPHTVYSQGKSKQLPKGKAVPKRSSSSAGGGSDGSGGNGGDGE
jgi:hypothetical protein